MTASERKVVNTVWSYLPIMSYQDYLAATSDKDCRQSWIAWKIDICGMTHPEAIKAAYDPEWGWEPILTREEQQP